MTEPESEARQLARYIYGDDCLLPYRPASHEHEVERSPSPPVNRVLDALLRAGCEYRAGRVDYWEAACPTHEDSRPSLVVKRNAQGCVWIKCWAGCPKEGILAALGLEWRDLWEDSDRDFGRSAPVVRGGLPGHLRRAMRDALARDDALRDGQ